LRDAFVHAVASEGFAVAVDTPFSGTPAPARHYRRELRVQSVMVEVNRRLYLYEANGSPATGFAQVARHGAGLLRRRPEWPIIALRRFDLSLRARNKCG
jgi:N-formylglutamate deformylase